MKFALEIVYWRLGYREYIWYFDSPPSCALAGRSRMSKYLYYLHLDSNEKKISTELSAVFQANCSEILKEALTLRKLTKKVVEERS